MHSGSLIKLNQYLPKLLKHISTLEQGENYEGFLKLNEIEMISIVGFFSRFKKFCPTVQELGPYFEKL